MSDIFHYNCLLKWVNSLPTVDNSCNEFKDLLDGTVFKRILEYIDPVFSSIDVIGYGLRKEETKKRNQTCIFNVLQDFFKTTLKVTYDIPDYSIDISKGDIDKTMKFLEYILFAAVNSNNKTIVIQDIEKLDTAVQNELMATIKSIDNTSNESIIKDTIDSEYKKQFENIKQQYRTLEEHNKTLESNINIYKEEINQLTEDNNHQKLEIDKLKQQLEDRASQEQEKKLVVINENQNTMIELESTIKQLEQKLSSIIKERDQKYKEYEEELVEKDQEIIILNKNTAQLKKVETKLELYKNKIEEMKGVYEENNSIKEKLNDLSAHTPASPQEVDVNTYKTKIYEQELVIKEYESTIHENNIKVEDLSQQVAQLKKSLRHTQNQLTNTINNTNSPEEDIDEDPLLKNIESRNNINLDTNSKDIYDDEHLHYEDYENQINQLKEELETYKSQSISPEIVENLKNEIERQNREIEDLKQTKDDIVARNIERLRKIEEENKKVNDQMMDALVKKDHSIAKSEEEKKKLEELYKKTVTKLSVERDIHKQLEQTNNDLKDTILQRDNVHSTEQSSLFSIIHNLGNKVMDKYYYSGLKNYQGDNWLDQARVSQSKL